MKVSQIRIPDVTSMTKKNAWPQNAWASHSLPLGTAILTAIEGRPLFC